MAKVLVGNFKGPKGDTGKTGPAGPQGPQGPQGPAGSTSYAAHSAQVTPNIKESRLTAGVNYAPEGGGTWACHSNGRTLTVAASGTRIPEAACCFRVA